MNAFFEGIDSGAYDLVLITGAMLILLLWAIAKWQLR